MRESSVGIHPKGLFKVRLIRNTSICPSKTHDGDAGFDVFNDSGDVVLWPGRKLFRLGFAIELPPGWMAMIQEKSGLALNQGIFTMGNVIDSSYRGECHAILFRTVLWPVKVRQGQKIAQMLIMPCYTEPQFHVVKELSDTSRKAGGFGSTGL